MYHLNKLIVLHLILMTIVTIQLMNYYYLAPNHHLISYYFQFVSIFYQIYDRNQEISLISHSNLNLLHILVVLYGHYYIRMHDTRNNLEFF